MGAPPPKAKPKGKRAAGLIELAQSKSSPQPKGLKCLRPNLANAEEWVCDCLDPWKQECGDSKGKMRPGCLRDVWCNHPDHSKLCPDWLEKNCAGASSLVQRANVSEDKSMHNDDVQKWSAPLKRRQGSHHSIAGSLDQTTAMKPC